VLFGVLTIGFVASTVAQTSLYETRFTRQSQEGLQAFQLAESGINRALRWLKDQSTAPAGTTPVVLFGGNQALGDGTYLVRLVPDANNPTNTFNRYTIESWGAAGDPTAPKAVRQTQLVVQEESFSRFAYFTDQERFGSSMAWFVTGDQLTGPTHTNGQFRILGSPVFNGDVSSVSDSIQYFNPPPTGGNNPVFNGSLTLGADEIAFPQHLPNAIEQAAQAGGTYLTGKTEVVLLANGRMQVTNSQAGYSSTEIDLPANGVLYVRNGDIELEGTLSGQLTVSTSHDVVIQDNILYADDPLVNPDSLDILGIVAGHDVEVDRDAPFDLEIQGAIMAMGTSFAVQNFQSGGAKGTLRVLGGIVQKNRGPIGTSDSSSGAKVSGYSKDYNYDVRLQGLSSPYFPGTGNYASLLWKEQG